MRFIRVIVITHTRKPSQTRWLLCHSPTVLAVPCNFAVCVPWCQTNIRFDPFLSSYCLNKPFLKSLLLWIFLFGMYNLGSPKPVNLFVNTFCRIATFKNYQLSIVGCVDPMVYIYIFDICIYIYYTCNCTMWTPKANSQKRLWHMGNDRFPNLTKNTSRDCGSHRIDYSESFLLGMFYWEVVVFQPSFLQGPC